MLGVILYRILMIGAKLQIVPGEAEGDAKSPAGEDSHWDYPFHASTRDELKKQILEESPRFPERYAREIPARLQTICLKCLNKDPEDRYRDGEAPARDLDAWLHEHYGAVWTSETIAAEPPSRKTVPAPRRFRTVARVVIACLGLTACVGLGLHFLPLDRPIDPGDNGVTQPDFRETIALPRESFVERRTVLLDAVAADLEALPERDRKFARFLQYAGTVNDVEDARRGIRLFVDWAAEVNHPVQYHFVDRAETILRIRLDGNNWLPWLQSAAHWERLVDEDPYRLSWSEKADDARCKREEELRKTMQTNNPIVRVDWLLSRLLAAQGDAANSLLQQWLAQYQSRAYRIGELAAERQDNPREAPRVRCAMLATSPGHPRSSRSPTAARSRVPSWNPGSTWCRRTRDSDELPSRCAVNYPDHLSPCFRSRHEP